jgi:hypothetical protein
MPAINITSGTSPDWNPQSNNPQIYNMFVGEDKKLHTMPGLKLIAALSGTLATWWTNYDGGNYIVVTELQLLRVSPTGAITNLASLSLSQFSVVEVTENLKFQLTITTGTDAYVFDQVTGILTDLGPSQGFELGNPISCTTLNSFTTILDANGRWNISAPNDALTYRPEAVQTIDPTLVKALAVKAIDNNLFIFGTYGIERWNPNLNTNVFLFPLSKDQDFKNNFGAISTNSIASDINNIYFLSSRYIPMQLSGRTGAVPIADTGIAKALSALKSVQNPLANNIRSSIYTYRSNYFFQLTFGLDNQTWVYCVNSKKWCNTDTLVLDSASIQETVLLADGLYELTTTPNYKLRRFVSDAAMLNKGNSPNRALLNGIELNIVAGEGVPSTTAPTEFVELYISIDRVTYSNALRIPLPAPGARTGRTRWPVNLAATFITVKIEYHGALDFTIEGIDAYIK